MRTHTEAAKESRDGREKEQQQNKIAVLLLFLKFVLLNHSELKLNYNTALPYRYQQGTIL